MKKILILLLAALFLTACGSNEESSAPIDEPKQVEESIEKSKYAIENEGLSQAELNEKIKTEAVQANFVELSKGNTEVGKRLFVVGKVVSFWQDTAFKKIFIETEEAEGFGAYYISDIFEDADYIEGDIIKAYGAYEGIDESGFIEIGAPVIEKQ
ncbi:hypothetical protein JMM81_12315 [Bacillus sp. V3B]|uniref:hypothetical protein n=1 Tax=Bacillus sp. V3B TaxID=2804915 RepID=UPI00210A6654|nr:hypothetical protein [Bacillus sp. V3B]MCQ6275740.1 hypothetical protein [Bacillus sp. V3B]